MQEPGEAGAPQTPFARAIDRLPTGAKLFLILGIALFPFALIALLAGLQTNRAADAQLKSQLRLAANEASHALSIELIGDVTALRVALEALDRDHGDEASCARAQAVISEQRADGGRLLIIDRRGRPICGSADLAGDQRMPPARAGAATAAIIAGKGLILALRSPSGQLTARILFPAGSLARIARPAGLTSPVAQTLLVDGKRLALQNLPASSPFDQTISIATPIGVAGLVFEMTQRDAPISAPIVITILLPMLMWGTAAAISWLVVDLLLIRPLRRLQARVARYQPGETIEPVAPGAIPAQEIRDLGETFRAISQTVKLHEADLAAGLVRQTKLTREVHHRVKNNLQVISSLINFHARGARSAEVTAAYAGIQRRVDALAVVHRHHFAEIDETRGLAMRSVIGDLAANIRANLPEGSGLSIILDLDPLLANQDVATAVAFLATELLELAMTVQGDPMVRISLKPIDADTDAAPASPPANKAMLRISAPALIDSDALRAALTDRYGRVLEGLSRQLRGRLHHDPLVGAFEIPIAITGSD